MYSDRFGWPPKTGWRRGLSVGCIKDGRCLDNVDVFYSHLITTYLHSALDAPLNRYVSAQPEMADHRLVRSILGFLWFASAVVVLGISALGANNVSLP